MVSASIIVSFFAEGKFTNKLFCFEPRHEVIQTPHEDGSIGVTFKENRNHPDFKPTFGFIKRN
jgi:hypothetical protein